MILKMTPPRLPAAPTTPDRIPLAKGCTCGTMAKLAPLEASMKNANPLYRSLLAYRKSDRGKEEGGMGKVG